MQRGLAIAALGLVLGGWHADAARGPRAAEASLIVPAVRAELRYPSARSTVGWGTFDLSASPDRDEIHVDLLLGVPARERRWTCGAMELDIDGRRVRLAARQGGVPMEGGVFDAVTAALSIEHVRAMVEAQRVRVSICGEEITLPLRERRRLEAFVRDFDDIGLYVGPSAPAPPPELGPDHEWRIWDPTQAPYPAPA